jgi:hypothetical protein
MRRARAWPVLRRRGGFDSAGFGPGPARGPGAQALASTEYLGMAPGRRRPHEPRLAWRAHKTAERRIGQVPNSDAQAGEHAEAH